MVSKNIDEGLTITAEQFKKLPVKEKLDIIYTNQETLLNFTRKNKNTLKFQNWAIGLLTLGLGTLFIHTFF